MTGISGDVGRRVSGLLCADGHQVVGVDVLAPKALDPAVEMRIADVRDTDALREAFAGCDVVVHLAFLIDQPRDVDHMRAVNIGGTQNVFRVAAELGVGHVVYTSSASAYGASPANDVPLQEESPLRAEELLYAGQKAELERWLAEFLPTSPRLGTTILRPAIVLGSGVENFIIRSLAAPRLIAVSGHHPPMQFVHVEDLAAAIVHAVATRIQGPYNVACEGWLSFAEISAILDRKLLSIPEELAHRVADQAQRFGQLDLPQGAVPYLMHPWVVATDKLVATGWQPRYTNRDALAVLADEIRDRVVVGPVDVSRAVVQRTAMGAVGAAAVVAALGVRWLLRRRSQHS